MKWRTPFNHTEFPNKAEKNNKPSMTIPDQTMSIREILLRHARGLNITGEKIPIYEGEEDTMPDLSKMDLADRQAIIEAAQEELEDIKARTRKKPTKTPTPPKTDENNTVSDAEIVQDDQPTEP